MRQIKLLTRDQIKQDLEDYDNEKHLSSPAHLEYAAQQYWDSYDYNSCLDMLNEVIELNPNKYVYFKRAQTFLKLYEYDYSLSDLDTALSLDPEYENATLLKELILEKVKREKDYTMQVYS